MQGSSLSVIALATILLVPALLSGCLPSAEAEAAALQPTLPAASDASAATRTPDALPAATTTATASPSVTPTPTVTPSPTPTPTPPAWRALKPGISQAYIAAPIPGTDVQDSVYALRIDPGQVEFRVFYEAGQARLMEDWLTYTRADVVVNGGFFSGDYRPVGRIVQDGSLYGSRLSDGEWIGITGLFTVLDGHVELYAMGRSTYSPRGMRFDQAIECYPMLLLPGRQPTYPIETELLARRTVIGLDQEGNVIILLINNPIFTLYELSRWLAASNLNLDSALNLDGGRSSGLAVNTPGEQVIYPSYVPVPIVLAINARLP